MGQVSRGRGRRIRREKGGAWKEGEMCEGEGKRMGSKYMRGRSRKDKPFTHYSFRIDPHLSPFFINLLVNFSAFLTISQIRRGKGRGKEGRRKEVEEGGRRRR